MFGATRKHPSTLIKKYRFAEGKNADYVYPIVKRDCEAETSKSAKLLPGHVL